MSVYYSPQLVRLLMNERIREAAQARLAREGERDCDAGHKRSILSLQRRHANHRLRLLGDHDDDRNS